MTTLETLFQSMDYCACEHCKSVLGPAAYLVELLEFCNVPDVPDGKSNPIDVLLARRPDLQNLLLSCENTNIALPHIDLVNEILENYIVQLGLDEDFGHNTREDSTTADLLADPEFVEDRAYNAQTGTNSVVFPHRLPFDMPLAALRLFMQTWGGTLADALRVFGTPVLARREVLALSVPEMSILTDIAYRRLPEYFGEPAGATIDALNATVAKGKTFCRRTEIAYEDLVRILRTNFINPGKVLVPRLQQLQLGLRQIQDWYDAVLDDAALMALLPVALDPAEYGGDVLQWLRVNRNLIMGLVTLTDVSAEPEECNFAAVELRFARPDANANRLTELEYQKLHRFIRLWRKLGWSIELTDQVMTSFLGMPPEDLTLENLDEAFTALLARLGNFVGLTRRLAVSPTQIEGWLAVWNVDQQVAVRQEKLAALLRIGQTDLVHFAEITGIDPLAGDMDADAPSLHRFIDAWAALKAMGMKVVDLDFIARHRDDAGKLTPTADSLLRDLKALRDSLTAVDAELSAVPDGADLAYARSKMALVYDARTVDGFFGLVSSSVTYAAPLQTVEEALPSPLADADSRIAFDPFGKLLTYAGIMTASARTSLEDAADELELADVGVIQTQDELDAFIVMFRTAVQGLFDRGRADLQALELAYPELRLAFDAVAAQTEPVDRIRVLLDQILPTLRGRLKTLALRTMLGSVLKIDEALVRALTGGPAVLHANADAASGVLADFLQLEDLVALNANQTYSLHFDPPATDDYILYIGVPAGTTATLAIDGTVVIPPTLVGADREVRTAASLLLESGTLIPAELTMEGLPADAAAELRWRTNGLAKAPIAASRLYSTPRIDAARAALIRLGKAALLLRAMPLTPRELQHLAADNVDTAGCLNDLDADGTLAGAALNAQWAKLAWWAWFATLKQNEPAENTWVALLEQPGTQTPQGTLMLAAASGCSDDDLNAVLTHLGLTPEDLSSLHALRRVKDAVDVAGRTSLPATDLIAWTTDTPDAALIAEIKQKLRTRHDDASWRATLHGVNDALRNQRRDALVSYILHHQPPVPDVDTPDKLYEYFLIDVEIDACMQTSRIRAALSTVQQFVTRCLMNLEPEVAAASIRADQWAWIKRYRVGEAARKIFLYPENYLEAELRDNKSPFFRELEAELLKVDITDELAETAYLSYLKKLDEVARLEIVGNCLEERRRGDQDDDVLHVFGRTPGMTRQLHYRRYESGSWTPWEKVPLNIEGDLLFPMVWRSQLFVFWLTVLQKPEGAKPGVPSVMGDEEWEPNSRITAELSLAWGEYYRGQWTSPKSSGLREPMRLTGLRRFEPEKVVLSARTQEPSDDDDLPERLVISVVYVDADAFQAFNAVFTSKNSPPLTDTKNDAELFLNVELFNATLLWEPNVTSDLDFNALREPGKVFEVTISQPAGALTPTLDETLLTKTDRLYDGFLVRPIMHSVENQWEAPLFYSDEHSVFFVSPNERAANLRIYGGYFWFEAASLMTPADAIKIAPLYEPPVIRDPRGPAIQPLEAAINPNYQWTISDDRVFTHAGGAFNARGLVGKGELR